LAQLFSNYHLRGLIGCRSSLSDGNLKVFLTL
jgi:hypothetical protein